MNTTTTSQTPDQYASDTLDSVLQLWADERQRTVVAIVTSGRLMISEATVMSVWSNLAGQYDNIDLVLQSYGGDANAAYQVVEVLRRHSKGELTAVVPFRAASAATLMCLGCDSILLDELARLGPLDMQVYEDKKGGSYSYKSALNPQMAIRQLNELSLASLQVTKNALVRDGVLADEAYEIASKFVIGLFNPLYCQVNPERLGEYSRMLAITTEYARRLLKRYSKLPDSDQVKLANKLVTGYPSHQYYIDYREAKEIGLPVQLMPDDFSLLAIRLLRKLYSADPQVIVLQPKPLKPGAKPTKPAAGTRPAKRTQGGSRKKGPAKPRSASRVRRTVSNSGGAAVTKALATTNGRHK